MSIKNLLCAIGIIGASYSVGKFHGEIKMLRGMINELDEVFPGCKRHIAESVSNGIVNAIFENDKEQTKE